MTKAIIDLGWSKYVLDLKDAVTVAEVLGSAERYEEQYVKDAPNTHHIYPNETQTIGTIKLIGDDLYRMAKLAGPPTKD